MGIEGQKQAENTDIHKNTITSNDALQKGQKTSQKIEEIQKKENSDLNSLGLNEFRNEYENTNINGDAVMLLGIPIGGEEMFLEENQLKQLQNISKIMKEKNIQIVSVSGIPGISRSNLHKIFTLSNGTKIEWNFNGNMVDEKNVLKQLSNNIK